MSRAKSDEKAPFPLRNRRPKDPAVKTFGAWPAENRTFFIDFCTWLQEIGYSRSTARIYGVAARQALGYLDQPWAQIDLQQDLPRARQYLEQRTHSQATRLNYGNGLARLAEYLRLRTHQPPPPRPVNWDYYLASLPEWLQADLPGFIRTCARSWKPERQHDRTYQELSVLCKPLRWIATHFPLASPADLAPQAWYAYLDERLEAGISPVTANRELAALKSLAYYWQEQERPVSPRFLQVDFLNEAQNLPKDAPPEQLSALLQAIQAEATHSHPARRRLGCMDLAWVLLMLHGGLRTAEVRTLRMSQIDWERRRLRLEQAKGLKDRHVFLSPEAVQALQDYLAVRGLAARLPEQVFLIRRSSLTRSYCYERLQTYGERCQVNITPHQLRHSCATLLLNAGAPVLSVKTLLGHKWVDTTLGYARLYDGTVAADYYAAMRGVEQRLALPEDDLDQPPGLGPLLALVDALRQTVLNEDQTAALRTLRDELLALATWEKPGEAAAPRDPALLTAKE